MTIRIRPAHTHESVWSLTELSEWVDGRIRKLEEDCEGGDSAVTVGADARQRSRASIATLRDVAGVIDEAVEVEKADRAQAAHEDRVEAAARETADV